MRRGGLWLFVTLCVLLGAYFTASRLGALDKLRARWSPKPAKKIRLTSGDFPAGVSAPVGGITSVPLRPVRIGFLPRGATAALLVACPPEGEGTLKAAYGMEGRAIPFATEAELKTALQRGGDAGGVDLAAMSVDRLAQWGTQLRDAAPRAILLLGRSRGQDALGAAGISALTELKGHTVAVARHTASEYFALWLTARAGLLADDVNWVEVPTPKDAAKALREGSVDAAVGFAGDLELAARERGGSILATTADAPHLIATVLVARGEFAARYPDGIRRLIRAVLDAGGVVARNSSDAARKLGEVAPYLGDPSDAIRAEPPSTMEDNLAFFGLAGEPPVTFEELFDSAGALYLKLGRTSQVPQAGQVQDPAPLAYVASARGP